MFEADHIQQAISELRRTTLGNMREEGLHDLIGYCHSQS